MRFFLILCGLLMSVSIAIAQATPAEQVAQKIAQKLKDSLALSEPQKTQLYNINIELHNQKMATRRQYSGNDSVGVRLQRIEGTRDSLYRAVLNEETYRLYKQKKRNLVSNN